MYSIVFILIKLPNFLDIHLGSPSKYATAFLKRMQTVDLNLYKSEFIQNPVFYFSIYFSIKAIFIAFMAFLLIILKIILK
jgi:hypothetical protein